MPSSSQTPARSVRLMSLDALRGFDMFWIIGAEDTVHALHDINHTGPVNLLAQQLTHKNWDGLAFYDVIFPLFVFIVGASLVFSLSKTMAQQGLTAAYSRILTRGVLLFLIGIFYYDGLSKGWQDIRIMGVLQRIALAYLFAGLIFCTFRLRGMMVICAGLLIGYWALMTFVPVPGVGAGHYEEGVNLANYIDKQYLPLRKWDGDHDPEGLLSTLPAIATCLLGVFAGMLLKNTSLPEQKKVFYLIAGGTAGIVLGCIWGLQFPIIKKIWTSSYVLVAGGISCLFLAAFHQIIEIWNYRRWAMPLVWIGMNAITIYLAHDFLDFHKLAERLVGGPIKIMLGVYGELVITTVVLAMSLVLVNFLYRKKLFLRL